MVIALYSGGRDDRGNVANWDFDSDSSIVTMVRPSKSKEPTPPVENHTPNYHGNENGDLQNNGTEEELDDEGVGEPPTPIQTRPPQLTIEDTVFVSDTTSPDQRNSLVIGRSHDLRGEEDKRSSVISVEGSSGIVVVSNMSLWH